MQPERLARLGLLFDTYGPLLTPRQRQVLSLVCEEDLSLGEVSGELAISRQGVHDLVRRAEAALEGYERRLGLVGRWTRRRERLLRLRALLEGLASRCGREPGFQEALDLTARLLGPDG